MRADLHDERIDALDCDSGDHLTKHTDTVGSKDKNAIDKHSK